jgi:hypothetical protein
MDKKDIYILPNGRKIKPLSLSWAIVLIFTLSLVFFLCGYAFSAWYFSFQYAHEFMELAYLPIYTALVFSPMLLRVSFFIVKKDASYWERGDFQGLYRFTYKFIFFCCLSFWCLPIFLTSIVYSMSTPQEVSAQIIDKRWYYIRNNPNGMRRNWVRVDSSFIGKENERIEILVTTEKFRTLKRGDIISFQVLKNNFGLILLPRRNTLELN